MNWTLARRAERLNPSTIREILKITEQPGIISLAGGLPSADTFPVRAMRDATATVLRDCPREALQYAASEGFAPLREWVAAEMATHGRDCDAGQVLITTGSQQGLDLVGKVLIDPGSTVAVASRMACTGKVSAEGSPPARLMMPGCSVIFRISRIVDGFSRSARRARVQFIGSPARPPRGRPAPPWGGEPAPSERLRAREWRANAMRLASRMAASEVSLGAS